MATRKFKDVDDYIASASDIARPILVKLRTVFCDASPKLTEAIKWNVPCYEYKGPVGGFAAFKSHVTWGLWKASLLDDPTGLIGGEIQKGGKLTSVAQIQTAELTRLIRQAVELNESGVKAVTPRPETPPDLADALRGNAAAAAVYAKFSAACQWQYVNWIESAKRPTTRATRIISAVQQIADGKKMK